MFRQVNSAAVGCVVVLLLGTQSILASGPAGRLRLGGFVGMAMSVQEGLNATMDDVEESLSHLEADWDDTELRSARLVGAYVECLISENWVVGVEFLPLSSSGGYDWHVDWDFDPLASTDVGVDYDVTGNVASVYGAYRYPLGDSPVALRLGAGVGYLFGAQFEMDYSYRDEYEYWTVLVREADLKASGSAVVFHGLAGVEYGPIGNLLFSANIAYRTASIDELKVDDFSVTRNGAPERTWSIEEGGILRWDSGRHSFSTQEGEKVALDFSGLHYTLSVAYVF